MRPSITPPPADSPAPPRRGSARPAARSSPRRRARLGAARAARRSAAVLAVPGTPGPMRLVRPERRKRKHSPTGRADLRVLAGLLPEPDVNHRRLVLDDLPVHAPQAVPAVVDRDRILDAVAHQVDDVHRITPVVWLLHEDVDPDLVVPQWLIADRLPDRERHRAPDLLRFAPKDHVPGAARRVDAVLRGRVGERHRHAHQPRQVRFRVRPCDADAVLLADLAPAFGARACDLPHRFRNLLRLPRVHLRPGVLARHVAGTGARLAVPLVGCAAFALPSTVRAPHRREARRGSSALVLGKLFFGPSQPTAHLVSFG